MRARLPASDVISGNIIYKLIDEYKAWLDDEKKKENETREKALYSRGVRILPNSCFRVSHPAVFGVDVLGGKDKAVFQADK